MSLWQTLKQHPRALLWAALFHVLAFVAIGVSFHAADTKIVPLKQEQVIEAVAVDEQQVQAELEKIKQAEQQKIREQKRQEQKVREAKQKRLEEEKRIKELKKQRDAEAAERKKAEALEKKRLADLEKQRKAQEQKQKEVEAKLAALEEQRKAEQAKREAEEKQRQLAEQQKKQAEQQRQLQAKQQVEIARYTGMIKSEITRSWVIPPSYRKGMRCEIAVRLIPSGDVVSFSIVKSSGDSAFDRSVEMAVHKASPLPVPPADSGIFDHFRDLRLVFDPNA